ncbi:hypothetical protein Scep_014297 [Stephania cephalantha]|uniref:Leucine-rich repeat-containing N-terminal plant-type domain-containing protein n=1 Tax=Stephania cephalantha TaxID=152367 RepID=A0AAP0J0Y4_9MAGN
MELTIIHSPLILIFITSLLALISSIAGDTSTLECDYCHPDDYNTLLKIKAGLNHPYIIINWEENGNCKDWCCISCDPKTHRVSTLDIGNDVIKPAARIPDAVGDLPDLDSLTLRKLVNLHGPIPRSIAKLKKLTFLSLDYNNLTGPVPGFLSQLPNLNYLRLSHNQLTGEIPASLSKLPTPLYVDLSHNQLTQIAPGFAEGLDFGTLSLERNKLAGDASMLFRRKNVWTSIIDISRNSLEFDFSNVSISK